jgi:glutamate synthase domain-containing protein 3
VTAVEPRATGEEIDLESASVRELNARLHRAGDGERFRVLHPAGQHSLAVGLTAAVEVAIEGPVGYYCAGMNQRAAVRVQGTCGVGVAENMMSGRVEIHGSAGQAAAATARGGTLVVRGNAAARCAISLKGADVVIEGSVGHASAFMAQTGRLLVCGDAGAALGDSLYEARLYVAGSVESLGADCVEKEVRDEHRAEVAELLQRAGVDADPATFRRYGSARTLYHFHASHGTAA